MSERPPILVAAFYAFTPVPEATRQSLLTALPPLAAGAGVLGSVLIATEGVNGTISGAEAGVDAVLNLLRDALWLGEAPFARLDVKRSWCAHQAFRRFRARRKTEIVSLGCPEVDPHRSVGTYVEPAEWNALIDDPGTLVIDTRNHYEVAIGSFEGAVDPGTASFRQFPAWVEQHLKPRLAQQRPQRIAMFCTGGIRCEKASGYLQQQGFGEVHHLRGGILNYLEQVPEAQSRWRGECFVFDQRVALNHRLEPGVHQLCHACGLPLTPEQLAMDSYIAGVQCLHCMDRFSAADRARFAERQRQLQQRLNSDRR